MVWGFFHAQLSDYKTAGSIWGQSLISTPILYPSPRLPHIASIQYLPGSRIIIVRGVLCLSLGFAACKQMLKNNFGSLAPAVDKPYEIVFCQLEIGMECSIFPIAETEWYGKVIKEHGCWWNWFPCFVSHNTLSYSNSLWILVVCLCLLFSSFPRFENPWSGTNSNFYSYLAAILASGT